MKPQEWRDWSEGEKLVYARTLRDSPRGKYVLGQALEIAMSVLGQIPEPLTEVSNLQDMDMLRRCIYNFPVMSDPVKLDLSALKAKFPGMFPPSSESNSPSPKKASGSPSSRRGKSTTSTTRKSSSK